METVIVSSISSSRFYTRWEMDFAARELHFFSCGVVILGGCEGRMKVVCFFLGSTRVWKEIWEVFVVLWHCAR